MRDGHSLADIPLEDRKRELQDLLATRPTGIQYVGYFDTDDGATIYQQAKARMLEGLVAKRLDSLYFPGERTLDWRKVKVPGAVPPERFKRRTAH